MADLKLKYVPYIHTQTDTSAFYCSVQNTSQRVLSPELSLAFIERQRSVADMDIIDPLHPISSRDERPAHLQQCLLPTWCTSGIEKASMRSDQLNT